MNKNDISYISNLIQKIEDRDINYTKNKKWIKLRNLEINCYKEIATKEIAETKNISNERVEKLKSFLDNINKYYEKNNIDKRNKL